jgi:hypothetical protein
MVADSLRIFGLPRPERSLTCDRLRCYRKDDLGGYSHVVHMVSRTWGNVTAGRRSPSSLYFIWNSWSRQPCCTAVLLARTPIRPYAGTVLVSGQDAGLTASRNREPVDFSLHLGRGSDKDAAVNSNCGELKPKACLALNKSVQNR